MASASLGAKKRRKPFSAKQGGSRRHFRHKVHRNESLVISRKENGTLVTPASSNDAAPADAPAPPSTGAVLQAPHESKDRGLPKICIILKNSELLLEKTRKRGSRERSSHSATSKVKLLHSDSNKSNDNLGNESVAKLPHPEVTHQCLMMVLDSPLNRHLADLDILLYNTDGKIIQVDPRFRIPRTWKVFMKVMSDFLSNPLGELKAVGADYPVLKLLQPPLSSHLRSGPPIISLSTLPQAHTARIRDLVSRILDAPPLPPTIEIELPPTDSTRLLNKNYDITPSYVFRPSFYPVSAAVICNRLCNALEDFLASETLPACPSPLAPPPE